MYQHIKKVATVLTIILALITIFDYASKWWGSGELVVSVTYGNWIEPPRFKQLIEQPSESFQDKFLLDRTLRKIAFRHSGVPDSVIDEMILSAELSGITQMRSVLENKWPEYNGMLVMNFTNESKQTCSNVVVTMPDIAYASIFREGKSNRQDSAYAKQIFLGDLMPDENLTVIAWTRGLSGIGEYSIDQLKITYANGRANIKLKVIVDKWVRTMGIVGIVALFILFILALPQLNTNK